MKIASYFIRGNFYIYKSTLSWLIFVLKIERRNRKLNAKTIAIANQKVA